MRPSSALAKSLDAADPLAPFRADFALPEGVVYLNGNSLGPLPAAVPGVMDDVVRRQWGERLIRAWNDEDWWSAPLRVGDRIGRLIGAAAGQTAVGESTSVQIFNTLVAAARLRPGRRVLVTEAGNFPTDRYLAASAARLLGLEVVETTADTLAAALDRHAGEVAVVFYPAVDYCTGALWDVAGITDLAHRAGALAMWDLSHAAGAVPVQVDADGVDLAVGCTYKYLSGGPGSPAYVYAAARHQAALDLPLTGWHGHARPFDMADGFEPAPDIARTRIGTPHVLSLLALEAALEPLERAGVAAVRDKSLKLGEFFLGCADSMLTGLGFEVATPRDPLRRGNHFAVRHPEAHAVMAALKARGVIGDVRSSTVLRLCLNGLYVSYTDVHTAVAAMQEVASTGAHRAPDFQVREVVT
ncbi:kynureninase [Actinomadura craniellae]|uniref:Kynureninase n=1 Tax=Actinomadura craniellae TaxID=2231787 RepID=A0A365H0J2_9ACTN|nr:kynureninase [Actinomadura craniellae]RAY12599.1 kynureninase [Actinomadura craniellae]